MDPRRLKNGDQVLGSSDYPFPGQKKAGPNATAAVVFSVGLRHGRNGSDTMIYVELKGGKRSAFRAADVSTTKSK